MDQIILFWLLGNWICLGFTSASGLSPRRIYNYGDSSRVLKYFKRPDIKNCSTLLLSEDEQTLYVGAQDKIIFLKIAKDFSMELQQPELSWAAPESERKTCYRKGKDYQTKCINLIRILKQVNATHLYACGTYAFNPQCAYIDLKTFSIITSTKESGGGRCPYDPNIKFAATMVDGELYAGTVDTFQGTVPTITRSLGTRPSLKTEASVNWLKDPVFVGSDFVPSSTEGDKVYFFFTETALEYDFTENFKVPRIARVCTNDIGGDRVLQRKWTTFLKVRLSCNPTNDIPYNIIQDSFFLKTPANPDDSTFYGIFNFQWRGRTEGKQSTICAFKLKDVEKAFKSTFIKLDKDSQKWKTIPFDSIPSPRPGSCNINTSFDNIFLFMKEHFLMEGKVLPDREQPLLAQVERYTKIVVEKVLVPFKQKAYDVMFLGTESGFLQKIVTTNSGPHIIESIQLFENQEPVQNLLLSTKKGVLYVGYSSGIVQIPVTNCNAYRTCGDCVLARDPYCGWDNSKQACQRISAEMNAGINWLQDIEEGKADSCKTTLRPRSKHPFPTGMAVTMKPNRQTTILFCMMLASIHCI
ncbi:semaphorin-4A isoform X2 [Protopterus annectens]|uniref:semaphorin-4A isoform X2 n=1 Tax=Protopterus annectens TaxID=7888 RepID=UPI001CF9C441|nr:semaphorin-4A isoform X2 [Protopterus annectens]